METRTSVLLAATSGFHVVLAAFHLLFWKLFRWKTDLARVSAVNRAVIQVLNVRITYVFLLFAWLMFAHGAELTGTALGRVLLAGIAIFWFSRAVEQIIFFGLAQRASLGFFFVCLVGGVLPVLVLVV